MMGTGNPGLVHACCKIEGRKASLRQEDSEQDLEEVEDLAMWIPEGRALQVERTAGVKAGYQMLLVPHPKLGVGSAPLETVYCKYL